MQGTVKFYNEAKRFGFIKESDTGTEYFVHASGLTAPIKQGDLVSFDVQEGKKGQTAVNVKVVG